MKISVSSCRLPVLAVALLLAPALADAAPGDLYEADLNSGKILEFNATGTQSTFATGLSTPYFLAFEVPEPSTWALLGVGAFVLGFALRRRLRAYCV